MINFSGGGAIYSSLEDSLINEIYASDIIFVCSAGNINTNVPQYPAGLERTIAVGAATKTDTRYHTSNYSSMTNKWVDVFAPGDTMISCSFDAVNGSIYDGDFKETSAAAPHVAALAGLMKSICNNCNVESIRYCIESTCNPMPNDTFYHTNPDSSLLGYGRINAYEAVKCIQNLSPIADFSIENEILCPLQFLQLSDESVGQITSWQWSVLPPNTAYIDTANIPNPHIFFFYPDTTYEVTLTVKNDSITGSDSISTFTQEFTLGYEANIVFPKDVDTVCNNDEAYFVVDFGNLGVPYDLVYHDNFGNTYYEDSITSTPWLVSVFPPDNSTTIYSIDSVYTNYGCDFYVSDSITITKQECYCMPNYNNNWVLSLKFNLQHSISPSSQLIGISNIPFWEGSSYCSSSISDANGNLLMYSNGREVFDKTFNIMGNGDSLSQSVNSSTQTSLIIQKSTIENNLYLVIVPDYQSNNYFINYSVLDLDLPGINGGTLSNPNGSVIQKNVPITGPSMAPAEKIISISNGLEEDNYWIISHSIIGNHYYVYHSNPDTIQYDTTYNCGYSISAHAKGVLKANLQGTMLASIFYEEGTYTSKYKVDLLSFDKNTGEIIFLDSKDMYQCFYAEFSPDGNYLYVCSEGTQLNSIYRFTVSNNSLADQTEIYNNGNFKYLQMAPNKESIYFYDNSNYSGHYKIQSIVNPNDSDAIVVYNRFEFFDPSYDGLKGGFPPLVYDGFSTLNLSVSIDTSCTCLSEAAIIPKFGCPPYLYTWNDTGLTDSIASLCPGDYQVTVFDDCGCSDSISFTIPEVGPIITGYDTIQPCVGDSSGAINLYVDGIPPYEFLWSNGATTQDLAGIEAGLFDVTVTHSLYACSDSIQILLESLPQSINIIANIQGQTCIGICDGSVYLNVTGYPLPFSYTWNTGQTTQDLNTLCPGMYTLTIQDSLNCTFDTVFTIDTTNYYVSLVYDDTLCGCLGTAEILTNYPNDSITWFDSSGYYQVDSLCPDSSYWAIIEDTVLFCIDTLNFQTYFPLNNPPMTILGVISNSSCNNTGYAYIPYDSISGGTSPYSYIWHSNYSQELTIDTISNLMVGTYYVTVYDKYYCNASTHFDITDFDFDIIVTANSTCNTLLDGSAYIDNISVGPPYYFSWSNGGTTDSVTNLSTGWNYVDIVSGDYPYFCWSFDSVYIDTDYELNFNLDISSYCNESYQGDASVNIITGVGPFSYYWSNGATDSLLNEIPIGNYSVTVTDANGCSDVEIFSIDYFVQFEMTVSNEICDDACDGSIFMDVMTTSASSYYFIIFKTDSTYADVCYPCDTMVLFSGLCPGEYRASAYDSYGCRHDSIVQVLEADTFYFNYDITANNCLLSNSYSITTEVSGSSLPFTYNWSTGASTDSVVVTSPGLYYVTVSDALGCEIVESMQVDSVGDLAVSILGTDPTCPDPYNGTLLAQATGGVQPYSYLWSNNETNDTVLWLSPDSTYFVTITDSYGCTVINFLSLSNTELANLSFDIIQPYCRDTFGGKINLTVSEGAPPFSYVWYEGSNVYSYQQNIDSCTIDSIYTVNVTGSDNCVLTASDTMPYYSNTLGLTFDIKGQGCDGISNNSYLSNGSIEVFVQGGLPPFTYSWSNDSVGNRVNGLSDGDTLTVTVYDADSLCYGTAIDSVWSEQDIALKSGWSIFSSYIKPYGNYWLSQYFEEQNIDQEVIISKDGAGNVWWPVFNVNNIQWVEMREGFQIKMNSQQELTLRGNLFCPEDTALNVPVGWDIISYIRTNPMNIETALAGIVTNSCTTCAVVIVKSDNGHIYWPLYGLNTIGNMMPGEGYQIKMETAEYLCYPANSDTVGTKSTILSQSSSFENFTDLYLNTDNNMVVGLPIEIWDQIPDIGDEIAANGEGGQLVGRTVFNGGFTALVIYGDDYYTPELVENIEDGESFSIQIWNPGTKSLKNQKIKYWVQGDALFDNNKISIAGKEQEETGMMDNNSIIHVYPNPGTGIYYIDLSLENNEIAKLEVFDNNGKLLIKKDDINIPKGDSTTYIDLTGYPNGSYVLHITFSGSSFIEKLILMQ